MSGPFGVLDQLLIVTQMFARKRELQMQRALSGRDALAETLLMDIGRILLSETALAIEPRDWEAAVRDAFQNDFRFHTKVEVFHHLLMDWILAERERCAGIARNAATVAWNAGGCQRTADPACSTAEAIAFDILRANQVRAI